jgi:16S rRNA processing protein RimM
MTVGEIVAPFGRIGEVKVRLETDFPDRFASLEEVCLRSRKGESRIVRVERARLHKGQVLLKLQGVESIDDAELLRNTLVQIRNVDAVKLAADEYYIHDLLGCRVLTANGETLGEIADVLRGGANDVYVVRSPDRGEILLPAIRDVIRRVDPKAKQVIVTPTPGLLPGESEEVR